MKEKSKDDDEPVLFGSGRRRRCRSSWTRLLNVLFWSWLNPVLSLAYRQPLTENDLHKVAINDQSSILLDRLGSYDWSLLPTWKIVVKEFGKEYIYASASYIPFLVICISQPWLVRRLISDVLKERQFASFFALLLLSMTIAVQCIAERQAVFRSARIAVRIRNALQLTIYKRSLSLKYAPNKNVSAGHIVNLIGNDTLKFEQVWNQLAALCVAVLEAILIFGILCWMFNAISAICAYVVLVLSILIMFYSNRKFVECRQLTSVFSDRRVQAFTEYIHGHQIVKLCQWEKPTEAHILRVRENELSCIRHVSRIRTWNKIQHFLTRPLLSLATFGSAWLLSYPFTITNTFSALLLFSLLNTHFMHYLPQAIESINGLRSASRRIDAFMRLSTEQRSTTPSPLLSTTEMKRGNVSIAGASFAWCADAPCLLALDILIKRGTLVGITGPVASGKSSLISAILGEMTLVHGQLDTHESSFSYTAQPPWIFAGTLRDNILLNHAFDEERYQKVIDACGLDVDFFQMGTSADLIELADEGMNLSGGQKGRVALARTIYAQADIYLFDDPLSAVDHRLARQIYERCIGPHGLLKNKTRVFVTHKSEFLQQADQVIAFSNGRVDQQSCAIGSIVREEHTLTSTPPLLHDLLDFNDASKDAQPIITDERSVDMNIQWRHWWEFFTAAPVGVSGFILVSIFLLLGSMLMNSTNYWLSVILRQSETEPVLLKEVFIYVCIIFATVVAEIVRTDHYFRVALNGANHLHKKMLQGLLYTSIDFFERNPMGRIIDRVSKDQYIMDELFPLVSISSIRVLMTTASSLFLIFYIDGYALMSLLVLIPTVGMFVHFYYRTSHQLKRLEGRTRSPVCALVLTSLQGLSTIRAFQAEKSFIRLIAQKIDLNTSASLYVQAATQWFALRITSLTALLLLLSSLTMIFFKDQIDPSSVAFSLVSIINISFALQFAFRQLCEGLLLMSSGERLYQYGDLPIEEKNDTRVSPMKSRVNWLSHGRLEFRDYCLRHRSGLADAIKNINLFVEPGEKVGIIGRTGAGKSSLFKGILRFVHQSNIHGEIFIDDTDISSVPLADLRSHLTVIPQQVVLFTGTIRSNLDPCNLYSDERCWAALEDVQLDKFVMKDPDGLQMAISQSGGNLSVGQGQLLTIARAILKKSKILLIDEGTAHVDPQTDQLIQTIIKQKFQDRTMLIIAHRLSTIARCDRIVVMDNGRIVDIGTPAKIVTSLS